MQTKWLQKTGGLSALALALAYIVIIALYVPIGAPPAGVEARLTYLAGHANAWWAILSLSVLTDFLFVPVAFALYAALARLHRGAMLLATACVALFVFLDLALTWTNYAALIALSRQYLAAVTDAQRAAILTAASYPSAVLDSGLLFVYNTLTLAIGIGIAGHVMRQGIFSRGTAWLGLATGLFGIVSVFGPYLVTALSATIILTSCLTTVWLLFVGYRLCSLSRQA